MVLFFGSRKRNIFNNIGIVLTELSKSCLHINLSKSQFFKTEEILRYRVNDQRIKREKNRIDQI